MGLGWLHWVDFARRVVGFGMWAYQDFVINKLVRVLKSKAIKFYGTISDSVNN
jgi:hypothetical protein